MHPTITHDAVKLLATTRPPVGIRLWTVKVDELIGYWQFARLVKLDPALPTLLYRDSLLPWRSRSNHLWQVFIIVGCMWSLRRGTGYA